MASLIFVIGIFVSGFFGLLYALSAVGVIWAYQSPNYLFNQTVPKYTNNLKGSVKSFLDFIYGVRLSSSLWVLNGIHNEKMREEIAFILRSLLRATFLPVSVFAGLSRNYSRKICNRFFIYIDDFGIFVSFPLFKITKHMLLVRCKFAMFFRGKYKN